MARYGRTKDPLKDALGAVCFVLVVIALVVGLIAGPDKGFDFLFWVSRKVMGFVTPDLYSSP